MGSPALLVIGGFLGAGKTTFAMELIAYLWGKDINAALITNDQSSGLVDSEIAAAGGVDVKEISGGCFCCQCDKFALALDEIAALREAEIVIAEAVGSCTDLIATVVEPLRVDLQKPYRVLPMTVVVDPYRAEAIFGRERIGHPPLHDDIKYIFLKQLEEAQIILVNKADAVPGVRMAWIVSAIEERYPEAEVFAVSAKTRTDVELMWKHLRGSDPRHRPIQEIDYTRYASGEARLAWLNAELSMTAVANVSMDDLSDALGVAILLRQVRRGVEITHLKVSIVAEERVRPGTGRDLSVVQCVSSAEGLIAVRRCTSSIPAGKVLINLRAQAIPFLLEEDVRSAMAAVAKEFTLKLKVLRLDAFAPPAPLPPYQRR